MSRSLGRQWPLVAGSGVLTGIGHGFAAFAVSSLLKPIALELVLSRAAVSMAIGLGRLVAGLVSPFVGRLADGVGPRVVVVAGLLVTASGLAAMSTIGDVAGLYLAWSLLVSAGVAAGFTVALDRLVVSAVSERRGWALAVRFSIAGGVTTLLMPVVGLMVEQLGWRSTCLAWSVMMLLLIPIPLLLFDRGPARAAPLAAADLDGTVAGAAPIHGLREALARPAFWILAVAFMIQASTVTGLTVHLIPMLTDTGLEGGLAAGFMGVLVLLSVPVRLVAGRLADRVGDGQLPWLLASIMGLEALAAAAFAAVPGSVTLAGLLFALAVGAGAPTIIVLVLITRLFGEERFGTLQGSLMLLQVPGTMVAPVLAGLSFDMTGTYGAAMWGFAAGLAVAAALLPRLATASPAGRRGDTWRQPESAAPARGLFHPSRVSASLRAISEELMSLSGVYARIVAWIGAAAILMRRSSAGSHSPVYGGKPAIPTAQPQAIPTLKMPTARGWQPGQTPVAAPGLKVNAFATGLRHPRQILVLPNGDVLAAEALSVPGPVKTPFDYAITSTMRRAGALGESPNRITLLRDADGDGVADVRETFLEGLNQPFGMALRGNTLYVGNTDGVLAFPYETGQTRISAPGRKVMDTKPGGHWTRNLLLSPDGNRLYVAVGSVGNIAEGGMAVEEGRACIHELDLETGRSRVFAGGLRNPVGMAWEPATGVLWTVVNERDGLGDETPPDYLTSVRDGGFYGWPYAYWGIVDDRVPQDPAMAAKSIVPDYALGGHTASLGLCWLPAGTLPGFPEGMAVGQHGSWNRSTLSGYKLAFVPFANGRPTGEPPRELLTEFLSADERHAYGRPVGVALAADGSVLLADDVGDVLWRVTGA